MSKKIRNIISTILPNKKTNYFNLFLISLGIISGAIFLVLIRENDKQSVIEQITTFMSNINSNNIDSVQALKTSLLSNFTYIFIIWILGLSIIGIIGNVFIVYIKGFVLGFSISSLIYVYGLKGIIASFIYLTFVWLLNLFVIIVVSTYSMIVTFNLYQLILGKRNINFKSIMKKYLIILLIVSIITIISSLLESFFIPAIFKLIIKLFI